jgi:membrane protein DedA with SNARE-associated domain
MTDLFVHLLQEYGYIILFIWSILEGEIGLIMAGILSHTGDMSYPIAIFVAGLGGFSGDQMYFYIGRYNTKSIHKRLKNQRRKFAIAHILLQRHGWPIIFMQRFMYGLRTIIPISIGITRYPAKKFAFINLLSSWVWATVTILPAYILGKQILQVIQYAHKHWYYALPFAIIFLGIVWYTFHKIEQNILIKRKVKQNGNSTNQ